LPGVDSCYVKQEWKEASNFIKHCNENRLKNDIYTYSMPTIWILRLILYTIQNRINGGLTRGSVYDVCNNLIDVS